MEEKTTFETSKPMVKSIWKSLAFLLLGILIGIAFSPVTKGMEICCNNTDSMNCYNDENKENKK